MTDNNNVELKTPIRFTYSESIELAKLYDEAEIALRKRGVTHIQYVWYDMAKELEKQGLCTLTEELNKYGRTKWQLIKLDKVTIEPIDPSDTLYRDVDYHKKIVQARRFLIDNYKAQK